MYVGIQQHNFPAQPIMIQPQQQNFRLPPLRAISEHGILSEYSDFGEDPEYKNIAEKSISRQGKNKGCGKLKAAKRVTQNETIISKIATTLLLQYDDFGVTRPPPKKLRQQQNKLRQRPRETKRVQTQRVQSLLHSPQRARSCRPALRPARAVAAPLNAPRAVAAPLLAPRAQSPPNSSPRAQSPHRPLHASPASPSTPLNSKAEG